MRNPRLGWIMLGLMGVISLLAWPFLPDQVPVHWNMQGEIDRYGSRLEALAFAPLIGLLIFGASHLMPKLDPRRENYDKFKPTYWLYINLTMLVIVALQLVTLANGLGWPIDVVMMVQIIVGLLFVGLGNELGRVRPSYFVGIRTPWTLANDEVWRRTHRVGGRLMVVAGLVIAGASFFFSNPIVFVITMSALAVVVLFAFGYSYLVYRELEQA